MQNIILFDTSIGTMNLGDEIIMESLQKNMKDILNGNFVVKFPTHTPCFHFYQQTRRNPRYRFVRDAKYKFICGTNIINNRMDIPWAPWNINFANANCYENSVLVGVGVAGLKDGVDQLSWYSQKLFSSFLSRTYKHSVRDERTKRIVESMLGEGSAINTGCPTVWGLTRQHCREIKENKADQVVFTLTDYSKKPETDQELIDTLLRNYTKVYYWPQGAQDISYFSKMNHTDKITIISPNIRSYSELLSQGNIDYVGTRLHAGIYSMQHKIRTIIIIVDNRAADMAATYNINTIARGDTNLESMIRNPFSTNVLINEERIEMWKSQFR
jgi:hypothetical protein